MLRNLKIGILLGSLALFANTAQAASIFFVPGTGEFGLNKEIVADLKIDSEDAGINAAQATIRFPKDMLEVKSIDKADSTFNFWLEEPTFSNEEGVISFVGGTPYGVSGASLQTLRITFTTKSSGVATVTIVDAAVTASDGSGTNVLFKTNDAAFTVAPETVAATVTPLTVIPPTQIKREPVEPIGLPTKPVLVIPLYSNPAEWSNHSNIFTASWTLPLDISGVATAINKQPNYSPLVSEGLFDSKIFAALSDGIGYLHIRFKNDIGWGPVAHYRLAVDTKAPLPFELTSSESEASDNPTPSFNFKTSDALSGLREYRVRVDNENWTTVPLKDFKGSYRLPNQVPGKHRLLVQATDNAGNSIEDFLDFETLPLASPTFSFVTDTLFSEETKGLTVKGTALPSTNILLSLKRGGALITSGVIPVDEQGNWEFTFSDPLRNGSYVVSIQNKDARGALSLVVDSTEISVAGKYTNTIILSFIVLLGALIGGWWFHKTRRERASLRLDVAESDAAKVFKMIEADVEKLKKADTTPTHADDQFITQKLGENVKKMGAYIKEEIQRAKE